MHITFVKKITADGNPCRKCAEVETKLKKAGLLRSIAQTVIADERDPASEGMQLAKNYQVDTAPFFIMRMNDGETRVYTIYFRFVKEILQAKTTEQEAAADILDSHPDLDYI